MLRYNWEKIYRIAEGNAVECFRIFKMITFRELPKSKYDDIYHYSQFNFYGNSFLLRPEALIYNYNRYSYRDLCIYIAIASQRSIAAYRVSGILTLELVHSKLDPRDYLTNKTLLPVRDGIIYFPFEEGGDI